MPHIARNERHPHTSIHPSIHPSKETKARRVQISQCTAKLTIHHTNTAPCRPWIYLPMPCLGRRRQHSRLLSWRDSWGAPQTHSDAPLYTHARTHTRAHTVIWYVGPRLCAVCCASRPVDPFLSASDDMKANRVAIDLHTHTQRGAGLGCLVWCDLLWSMCLPSLCGAGEVAGAAALIRQLGKRHPRVHHNVPAEMGGIHAVCARVCVCVCVCVLVTCGVS